MEFLRSPFGRTVRALCLLSLLGLSILFIKNIVTAAAQSDQQAMAEYERSPGCFPNRDPSQVDPGLPPCRNVMLTVIAKPQKTTVDHRSSGDYPRTRRFLTLQLAASQPQTVGDIHEDFWNSIRAGDQVSAVVWRDKVQEVSANGYSQPIIDMQAQSQALVHLVPWGILSLLCSTLLSLQWKLYRRSSPLSLRDF